MLILDFLGNSLKDQRIKSTTSWRPLPGATLTDWWTPWTSSMPTWSLWMPLTSKASGKILSSPKIPGSYLSRRSLVTKSLSQWCFSFNGSNMVSLGQKMVFFFLLRVDLLVPLRSFASFLFKRRCKNLLKEGSYEALALTLFYLALVT